MTEHQSEGLTVVKQPYLIIFKDEESGKNLFHIYPDDLDFKGYGLLLADAIRHVASAFGVPESSVYDWVKKEMKNPTTAVTGGYTSETKQ